MARINRTDPSGAVIGAGYDYAEEDPRHLSDPGGVHNPDSKLSRVTDPLGINRDAASADITGLQDVAGRGDTGLAGLQNERQTLQPNRAPGTESAALQTAAVTRLRDAAGGAPSAAQQQLQQQAQLDAARQVGLAKAIRGHSAGGSARQTALGVASVQAHAADTGRVLAAQEQDVARTQLAQALQQKRAGDISGYRTDVDERNQLLAAQLQQRQLQEQIAAGQAQANALAAGGENARNAAAIGAVGAGGSTLIQQDKDQNRVLSDRRAKNIDGEMADYIRRRGG